MRQSFLAIAPKTRILILSAAVALLGVGMTLGIAAERLWTPLIPFRLPLPVLAVAFYAAYVVPIRRVVGTSGSTWTMSELPLTIALYASDPITTLIAWTLGGTLAELANPVPMFKKVFNQTLNTIYVGPAFLLVHLIADPSHPFGARSVVAIPVALLVSLAGSPMVSLAVAVFTAHAPEWDLHDTPIDTLQIWVSGALGIFVGLALQLSPWLALLVVLPEGLLMVLTRGYFRAREREHQIQGLYDTSHALLTATRLEDAVERLLRHSLALFRADVAGFLLLADGEMRLFTIEGDAPMTQRSNPPSAAELEAVYAIGDHEAVLVDRHAPAALREVAAGAWGVDGGLVGTVRSGNEPALLLLHPRQNIHQPYGPMDLQTLRTLVTQVSTVLDRTRLLTAVERMQELQETLQHQAEHDPLTGLANRARLLDRLDAALASDRSGGVAVIYVDVDDFKPINDTHGHAAGDAVLQAVAERLRSGLRGSDLAARLGGDEFAVLLDGVASDAAARDVAARLATRLDDPIVVGGTVLRVRASLGIATTQRGGDDAQHLLVAADEEMYRVKRTAKRERLRARDAG